MPDGESGDSQVPDGEFRGTQAQMGSLGAQAFLVCKEQSWRDALFCSHMETVAL